MTRSTRSNGVASRASSHELQTLKIKTGTVRRTQKDLESYREELVDVRRTVDRVRASSDHSKLKQWETVLAETQAMIPDSTTRLYTAVDDLTAFIDTISNEQGVQGSSELAAAQQAIAAAESALND